jgi:TP901 family phage tail tape measure protein
MAKTMKFGIVLGLRDAASRGLRKVRRNILSLGKALKTIGGGRVMGALAMGGPVFGFLAAGATIAVKAVTTFVRIALAGVRLLASVVSGIVRRILAVVMGAIRLITRLVTGLISTITDLLTSLLRTVKRIAIGATAAFAALSVWAVKLGADFETAMAEVASIATGITGPALDFLQRKVERLAVLMGKDAAEMARGLYQAISAGATGAARSTEVLRVASMAAIAGITDMETAVKAITRSMNAWGISVRHAERIGDVFFEGVRLGVFRFAELEHAVGTVAGIAATLGVSLQEIVASFAALTRAGLGIDRAATGLRSLMSQMLKPTKEALQVARALGLELSPAALKRQGLVGMLWAIRRATGGRPDLIARLFPNRRALASLLPLLTRQFPQFLNFLRQIGGRAGALGEAFRKMTNTLSFAWNQMWQQLKDTARAFFLPVRGPLIRLFKEIAKWLRSLKPLVKELGRVVGEAIDFIRRLLFGTNWDAFFKKIVAGINEIIAALRKLIALLLPMLAALADLAIAAAKEVFAKLTPIVRRAFQKHIQAPLMEAVGAMMIEIGKTIRNSLDDPVIGYTPGADLIRAGKQVQTGARRTRGKAEQVTLGEQAGVVGARTERRLAGDVVRALLQGMMPAIRQATGGAVGMGGAVKGAVAGAPPGAMQELLARAAQAQRNAIDMEARHAAAQQEYATTVEAFAKAFGRTQEDAIQLWGDLTQTTGQLEADSKEMRRRIRALEARNRRQRQQNRR